MTTPNDDAGPMAEVQEAAETLKAAILAFFEANPLPDEHRQLDKDQLHTEVMTRIQQQPNVAAQTAQTGVAPQPTPPKQQPAAPHAAAPHAAAPHTAPHSAPHAAANAPAQTPHTPAAKPHTDHPKDERAQVRAKHPELETLIAYWDEKCPKDRSGVPGLEPHFGSGVAGFIAAMEDAGLHVDIKGCRRSLNRAYLMRCAYLIYHGKSAEDLSPEERPKDVTIDWVKVEKDLVDRESFKGFAALLAERLGVGLGNSRPPSLTSNHIKGLAIDMAVTGWEKGTSEVAGPDGASTPIRKFGDLVKVGAAYGVHHFAQPGEPYHWSVNSR